MLISAQLECDRSQALGLAHPQSSTQDTQIIYMYNTNPENVQAHTPALKKLVAQEFGVTVQNGEHDSITDARAAMALYRKSQLN